MKRFVLSFLLSLWIFPCASQETPSGNVILDLQEEETTKKITLSDTIGTTFEIANYFNKNYPGKLIDSDLKPDIEKFFPNLSRQELYDKESFIRNSIKLYRWGKGIYEDAKSKFLVPETPILTYRDSEYENPKDYKYVDAGEDNVRVTTDIKKVISYSADRKEQENYHAHKEKMETNDKIKKLFPEFERLARIYDKIEFKKLPFYGIVYDDPKTEGEGITPWLTQEHAKIRLASDQSRLENQSQIKGIVHFKTDANWGILAENYDQYPEITVTMKNSQNLKKCSLFRPVPRRAYFADGDLIIYGNDFAYPFICTVENNEKTATIKTHITYTMCNAEKNCKPYQADLSLPLKAGLGFNTVLQNFITQTFNLLPRQEEKDITIQDVALEHNDLSPTGDTLRLIIDSNYPIDKPDIFIRTTNNIKFASPKIAIDNNRFSARFDVLSPHQSLEGQELEITFRPDKIHTFRLFKPILSASVFDINSRILNLGLILLAVLGGFILNFMPCVFPVLSLKILSLTQFGAKNEKHVKLNFLLSALGIIIGFLILAVILSAIKLLGHNLGWGMQFQNPFFLLTMIFAVLLFIAQIHGIIHFSFPIYKAKLSLAVESFFSGLLVVLMATPCTGPYLGTTIGFALSSNISDIFAILMAVALGLSLPYLLLAAAPNLSIFIPRPGQWMNKFHHFMVFLLIITILWLLTILKAQSSFLTVLSICGLMILFYFILSIYHKSILETEHLSGRDKKLCSRAKQKLHLIFATLLSFVFVCSLITGYKGFINHKKSGNDQTTTELNLDQIGHDVAQGYNVLVKVGADWCLTCSYNNLLVFDNVTTKNIYDHYNLKVINLDWTEYKPEILEFMSEYGRRGLPFYILYNQNIPEGLVLPEILSQMEFERILNNSAVIYPISEKNAPAE